MITTAPTASVAIRQPLMAAIVLRREQRFFYRELAMPASHRYFQTSPPLICRNAAGDESGDIRRLLHGAMSYLLPPRVMVPPIFEYAAAPG